MDAPIPLRAIAPRRHCRTADFSRYSRRYAVSPTTVSPLPPGCGMLVDKGLLRAYGERCRGAYPLWRRRLRPPRHWRNMHALRDARRGYCVGVLPGGSTPSMPACGKTRRAAAHYGALRREKDREALAILLRRHVIALGLEEPYGCGGNRPFADIIHEIDGRAAMAVASSLLADAVARQGHPAWRGWPALLPCEVTITGSDVAACAAALRLSGINAIVRMFDNNVYKLREMLSRARQRCD